MESELQSATLSERITSSTAFASHLQPAQRNNLCYFNCKALQKGSFLSGFLTLSASIGGSGMLAMPYAFRLCGWPAGVCTVVFGMLINLFTCYILLQAAKKQNVHNLDQLFCDLVEPEWVDSLIYKVLLKFTEVNILLNNYGSIIAYIVVVRVSQTENLVPQVLRHLGVTNYLTSPYLWGLVLTVAIILPLSYLKNMAVIRYPAMISFLASSYVVVVITAKYFTIDVPDRGITEWSLLGQLKSLSIILFAFSCQPDVCLIVQVSLTQDLKKKDEALKMLAYAMGLYMLMFVCVGLLGYLTYPQSTPQNILQGNHYDDVSSIIVILMFSLVEVAYHMFGEHRKWSGKLASFTVIGCMRYIVIVTSAAVLAIAAQNDFSLVIGFVGALSSSYVCIMPCVWYLRCTPEDEPEWLKLVCFFVLVSVSCICFACFIALIADY